MWVQSGRDGLSECLLGMPKPWVARSVRGRLGAHDSGRGVARTRMRHRTRDNERFGCGFRCRRGDISGDHLVGVVSRAPRRSGALASRHVVAVGYCTGTPNLTSAVGACRAHRATVARRETTVVSRGSAIH